MEGTEEYRCFFPVQTESNSLHGSARRGDISPVATLPRIQDFTQHPVHAVFGFVETRRLPAQ